MVEIKGKLKLDRSTSSLMHRRQIRQIVGSSTYYAIHKEEETVAKRFKIVLAENTNWQEAAEKSRNNWKNEHTQKIIRLSKKSKKSCGPFRK